MVKTHRLCGALGTQVSGVDLSMPLDNANVIFAKILIAKKIYCHLSSRSIGVSVGGT